MTVTKALLYSLLLPAFLSVVLLINNKYSDGGDLLFMFMFIIVIWAVGLLLGLFIAVIFKNPANEPFYFLTGQMFVILPVAGMLIYEIFDRTPGEKSGSHRRASNHFLLNSSEDEYDEQAKIAFDSLLSKYKPDDV